MPQQQKGNHMARPLPIALLRRELCRHSRCPRQGMPTISRKHIESDEFDENLKILFSNLTSKAVQRSPNHLFATRKTLFPDSQTIYALVQCVKDISADQCGWCLRNARGDIAGCFNGREGDRILRGSCSLSFGMQSFFAGYPALVSSVQPNHEHAAASIS
ncbi:hypothetical protein EJ110_NYTH25694 [Nymphaea thermarum]|nr:hypothetical protein EJ110_NYTH25694 [Nymphaea thermarum]